MRSAFVAYDADNFAPDDDELVAELEEGEDTLCGVLEGWNGFSQTL